jgi:dTDP-4-amino-4,6-dideoxygalactose transaminase
MPSTLDVSYQIPCLDLSRQYQQLKAEVMQAVETVFDTTSFSGGPFVDAFEREFADYIGTPYALGVNNGTSALHLALRALDIGPGDEVIVPANTFIATAWAVTYVGATIRFIDCTADTYQLDPAQLAACLTPRTRAIAGVHLYGQPFDVSAVQAFTKAHGLYLIEDSAQAQGARYRGQRVGSFGDIGCFSFYPGKNLGAYGEAGGLTTHHAAYDARIRSLRQHGMTERYYHDELGYNMRMDAVQGAILSIKLRYLDDWNARRQAIARRYQTELRHPDVRLQVQPDWAESVYHLFVVTVPERAHFMAYLQENGISAGLHYPVPCHLQRAYAPLGYQPGDFPNAEYLAAHCVSLPMFAELTDDEVSYLIEVVNRYPGGAAAGRAS